MSSSFTAALRVGRSVGRTLADVEHVEDRGVALLAGRCVVEGGRGSEHRIPGRGVDEALRVLEDEVGALAVQPVGGPELRTGRDRVYPGDGQVAIPGGGGDRVARADLAEPGVGGAHHNLARLARAGARGQPQVRARVGAPGERRDVAARADLGQDRLYRRLEEPGHGRGPAQLARQDAGHLGIKVAGEADYRPGAVNLHGPRDGELVVQVVLQDGRAGGRVVGRPGGRGGGRDRRDEQDAERDPGPPPRPAQGARDQAHRLSSAVPGSHAAGWPGAVTSCTRPERRSITVQPCCRLSAWVRPRSVA